MWKRKDKLQATPEKKWLADSLAEFIEIFDGKRLNSSKSSMAKDEAAIDAQAALRPAEMYEARPSVLMQEGQNSVHTPGDSEDRPDSGADKRSLSERRSQKSVNVVVSDDRQSVHTGEPVNTPGMVNSMEHAEPAKQASPMKRMMSGFGSMFGRKTAKQEEPAERQEKSSKLSIPSAQDGLLEKVTEVEVNIQDLQPTGDEQDVSEEADKSNDMLFGNESEGRVVMKNEVRVVQKTVQELDEEKEAAARKNRKTICGIVIIPFEELPDLAPYNIFMMEPSHPTRRRCLNLAVNPWVDGLCAVASLVHFLLGLPEIQQTVFMCEKFAQSGAGSGIEKKLQRACGVELPFYHHYLFIAIYWTEAMIKIIGFGFWGAKFAYWTHDVYNKLDFLATVFYTVEVILLLFVEKTFSLRALRIFRMLKPMSRLSLFADLEIIFHSLGKFMLPLGTIGVMCLMAFLLLSIMGMSFYGDRDFRRRCVWADDLTVKMPETWCIRNDNVGLSSRGTCGPFQLCLDGRNPNYGYTHFENMFSAILTVFQAFSGDRQYQIMSMALQSKQGPLWGAVTLIFFAILGFALMHIFMNVFVSALTNIFSQSRMIFSLRNEERLKRCDEEIRRLSQIMEKEERGKSESGSSEEDETDEVDDEETGKSGSSEEECETDEDDKEQDQTIPEKHLSLEKQVRKIKTQEVNPLLQSYMIMFFRNPVYESILFLISLAQAAALFLDGSVCWYLAGERNCWVDDWIVNLLNGFNLFHLIDFFLQVLCDGSLAKHFQKGEVIFNFLVTIMTTVAVIGSALGLDDEDSDVLRAFAVFRVLRGFKHGAWNPLWKMLEKAVEIGIPIANLALMNILATMCWFLLGRVLFEDTLTEANIRFNYGSIQRGYMLLIRVMTGDSWSDHMYEGMSMFCTDEDTCSKYDRGYMIVAAFYYIFFFCYGQFVFITIYLAYTLEIFSVNQLMDIISLSNSKETMLKSIEECRRAVADFHMLPVEMVNQETLWIAWVTLSDSGGISKTRLHSFYLIHDPKTTWRWLKYTGIILMRQLLRATIFYPCHRWQCMQPYPGDYDYVVEDRADTSYGDESEESALLEVAMSHHEEIREHMGMLIQYGMVKEVIMVAMRLGLVSSLDAEDIRETPSLTALQILRNNGIAKRIGTEGHYDKLIQEALFRQKSGLHTATDDEEDSPEEDSPYLKKAKKTRGPSVPSTRWKFMVKISKFIATNKYVDSFVFFTIMVSSISLLLEKPDVGTKEIQVQEIIPSTIMFMMEIGCNIVFAVEALSKICAFGLMTPFTADNQAYLQTNSNRLDFFVLLLAVLDNVGLGQYVAQGSGKIIRLMKLLRPLRLLLRGGEGMTRILIALVGFVKPMIFAVLFLLVLLSVFSVFAMAFFKHKFGFCTDTVLDGSIGEGLIECFGSFMTDSVENGGFSKPRAWLVPGYGQNFDTFGSSVLLLFRSFTMKWTTYYALAQDAAFDEDVQPIFGQQMVLASIFFHLFMLFGSVLCMAIFKAFACNAFHSAQGENQLEESLWKAFQTMIANNYPMTPLPPRPTDLLSRKLQKLLENKKYQAFSAACILLNVGFVSSAYSGQPESYTQVIELQNNIIFGQMCLEALLTCLSLRPNLYFRDNDNRLDVLLILATSITMSLSKEFRTISQILRMFRCFKILKKLIRARIVDTIFETTIESLWPALNIFVVLVIFTLVVSVIAVQLFGRVRFQERLGPQLQFSNSLLAMRSIFQILFGDEWHVVQDECMIEEPFCTPDIFDPNNSHVLLYATDCGGFASGVLFFPFLKIALNYVILNLFTGMIMCNFAYIKCKDSNGLLEPSDFVRVTEIWVSEFDPQATGTIKLDQVYQLMIRIGEPLGTFGTTENVGRYLCIREELRQKSLYAQEDSFSSNRIYNWVKNKQETIYSIAFEDWEKGEHEFRAASQALIHAEDELEAREQYYASMEPNKPEEEVAEEEELDEGKENLDDVLNGVSDGYEAFANPCIDPDPADEVHELAKVDKAVANTHCSDDEVTKEKQEHVHGGNMGLPYPSHIRRQAWITGGLLGTAKRTDWRRQKSLELAQLRQSVAEARSEVERTRKVVNENPAPTVGMKAKFWTFCRSVLETVKPSLTKSETKQGYAKYNDVMTALLHWNKGRNIVPKGRMEERKEQVDQIVLEVAFQLVQALLIGGFVRWRKRRAAQAAKARVKQACDAAKKMGKSLLQTKHLMMNREEDLKKAMFDAYASTDLMKKIILDSKSSNERVCCAKIILYGISKAHDLAGYAMEAGVDLDSSSKKQAAGVFGLDDDSLQGIMAHPKMMKFSEHIKAIETLENLVARGQQPLLMLAAQVCRIEFLEAVPQMRRDHIFTLLSEANVQTVIQNMDLQATRPKKKRIADGLPDSSAIADSIMHLDESVLDEFELVRMKIKKKEEEKESLTKILEQTQERMFQVRMEFEQLVEETEKAKQATENPAKGRRYDASSAFSSARPLQSRTLHLGADGVKNSKQNTISSPAVAHVGSNARQSKVSLEPVNVSLGNFADHDQDSQQDSSQIHNGNTNAITSHKSNSAVDTALNHRVAESQLGQGASVINTTSEVLTTHNSMTSQAVMTAPVPESELSSQIKNDPRKLQEQIAMKKAEMEQLQKLLERTRRENARGSPGTDTPALEDAESMQDKLERARQQREERMMKQVSSESASTVMVSPRGERKKTQDLLQNVVGRKANLSWL